LKCDVELAGCETYPGGERPHRRRGGALAAGEQARRVLFGGPQLAVDLRSEHGEPNE
jgi:hypothetical protein